MKTGGIVPAELAIRADIYQKTTEMREVSTPVLHKIWIIALIRPDRWFRATGVKAVPARRLQTWRRRMRTAMGLRRFRVMGAAVFAAALAVPLFAGSAQAAPDFEARNPSLSASSAKTLEQYTFEAEVINLGDSATLVGATVELEYRKSGQSAWTEFYTRILPLLNHGVKRTYSNTHWQSATGTYEYRACVTSASDDSDSGNNCSSSTSITITSSSLY